MPLTIEELYLAYRQAKTALYYERRGVGLLELAAFEERLPQKLAQLGSRLDDSEWFESVDLGDVWVVPKRLRRLVGDKNDVIRIGAGPTRGGGCPLEVQLRLSPSPQFAVLEVLYLWRFGAALDSLLSRDVLGYRLDLRNGQLFRHRRWLFEYWPRRYQQFRTAPLNAARQALSESGGSVLIVSADLASFYDTIDPSFLLADDFVVSMETLTSDRRATSSLLRAYARYRTEATRRAAIPIETGVPIGALTSRVFANVALAPLDAHITAVPDVICYRRYVDDLVIVAKTHDGLRHFEDILRSFLPLRSTGEPVLLLDMDALGRPGSCFQLQRAKVRIHHLTGVPGRDFVDAVAADFDRVVSERRAFLDTATLLHDGASHLVRASQEQGSPLRVLRDADRVRLERFSLSTSLHSLERVSAMVDREHARGVVRRSLERVGRVLDAEDNWVDNLDVALRLLKLAISTEDWDSCAEVNARMEEMWGTVEALRATTSSLHYRGREIDPERSRPWAGLRNYLHARRLEAVCSVLPSDVTVSQIRDWLPEGLRFQTGLLGAVALRRRARMLAASDLRSRDREDDRTITDAGADIDMTWMEGSLAPSDEILARLATIRTFVERCQQLGDRPWLMPPARLFLCTRPPSYFDIARRWLYRTESEGFGSDVFEELLRVVNAVRGTDYQDPVGSVEGPHTVCISGVRPTAFPRDPEATPSALDPRVILGNLVVDEQDWTGAATRVPGSAVGAPRLHIERLLGLNDVLLRAARASRAGLPTVLVLPELSLPRLWFRTVSNYVVRFGGFGLVVGLEYLHDISYPYVRNQAFAVLPGPFSSVATWPWTKRLPARDEQRLLAALRTPVSFPPPPTHRPPRTTVRSPWGTFSVLICSELIEARRVADLLGRADLVVCPAWNRDTSSYDHLIQSVGFQLHAIIAVANNGHYSDCRAWAPRKERWERDLCRLIERDVNDVVYVDVPLSSLEAFHASRGPSPSRWRPLPPDWP